MLPWMTRINRAARVSYDAHAASGLFSSNLQHILLLQRRRKGPHPTWWVTMLSHIMCCRHVVAAGHANNAAAITRLRTMVASLKEGASFCKRLAASLQQVQVLLASRQASVIHDAIVFLTLCK